MTVINSTNSSDGHSKSDEDVLYQKGASFSAKLANDNADDNHLSSSYASSSAALASSFNHDSDEDIMDGEDESSYISDDLGLLARQQKVNSNDYYISNEGGDMDAALDSSVNDGDISADDYDDEPYERHRASITTVKPITLLLHRNRKAPNVAPNDKAQSGGSAKAPTASKSTTSASTTARSTTMTTTSASTTPTTESTMLSDNLDELDDYYAKQDMSVYDDVNNNQLNLRPINHLTYQLQPQQQQQLQQKRQLQQQKQQHHQMEAQTSSSSSSSTSNNNINNYNTNNNRQQQQQQQQYHTSNNNNKNLLKTATAAQTSAKIYATATSGTIEKISTNISYNLSSSETNE